MANSNIISDEQRARLSEIASRARLLGPERHRTLAASYADLACEAWRDRKSIENIISDYEHTIEHHLGIDATRKTRAWKPLHDFKIFAGIAILYKVCILIATLFISGPQVLVKFFSCFGVANVRHDVFVLRRSHGCCLV
jgi:hypothetical protein